MRFKSTYIDKTENRRMFIVTLCFMLLLIPFDAFTIDRRQDQFKSDPSYLILPAPYSVAGVGQGIAYTGMAANIADTYFDLIAVKATGDAEAYLLGLYDIHLITETLILDYDRSEASKLAFNTYSARGIETEKDDYTILQFDQFQEDWARLTLSFFERRAELSVLYVKNKVTAEKILDNEENVQTEFEDPSPQLTEETTTSLLIDYTDDYLDPRKGARLRLQRSNSPPTSESESNFSVINKELSVFIPIGDFSTWAFYGLFSDADVTNTGITDPDEIATELGLSCSYISCTENEQNLIDRKIVEREKGTAKTLGGFNHLRSYPLDRFQGAHTRYFSTEFRFNFANEVMPFNFWIWKDVSTSLQCVFFYDRGTVAETQDDLWKESVDSIGVGFRMIAGSGRVYRADWATGEEGSELTVVFAYPW
jgi:surface antigen Omp85-like protein